MLLATAAPADTAADAREEELWFPVGERLIYRAYWGRIRVGTSETTSAWVEEDGQRHIRLRIRTRTNRVLSAIYPVDSLIESYVDPETFLPVRFVKDISEGRSRHDEVTTFDWEAGTARWHDRRRDRERTLEITPDTRCIPSLLFYVRRTGLTPGERVPFRVMADDKIYDLVVVAEEIERVRLPRYGRVPSLRAEPQAEFDGIFVRSGRMWIWTSRDPRRVATRISVEVPIARVHFVLERVRGPGTDFWVGGDGDDLEDELDDE